MNLGDLLPVFAATDAAAASAERNGKFTEFPDEEPTVKQMNDWLEVNLPVITKSHGELMRGALPPALIQLKAEADADLTDYVPVTVDTTTAKTTMEGQRHNKAVRDAAARKTAATETLLSSLRHMRNGVAQDLIEALTLLELAHQLTPLRAIDRRHQAHDEFVHRRLILKAIGHIRRVILHQRIDLGGDLRPCAAIR